MSTWITMLTAGLGTYLLRISMVAAHERFGTVDRLNRHLRFVSPSVLAAILAASLLVPHDQHGRPAPAELAAVVAAFVAVRRTGNAAWALAVGFPVYWGAVAVGLN
jgi:branched chain amino acid efflux pump